MNGLTKIPFIIMNFKILFHSPQQQQQQQETSITKNICELNEEGKKTLSNTNTGYINDQYYFWIKSIKLRTKLNIKINDKKLIWFVSDTTFTHIQAKLSQAKQSI